MSQLPIPTTQPSPGSTVDELTVLIDDVRRFRDERPCHQARTSAEGLALLRQLQTQRIDHLWLDHDLIGADTVMPILEHLIANGHDIGTIHVHTANISAGQVMMRQLAPAGYAVVRSYNLRMWTW